MNTVGEGEGSQQGMKEVTESLDPRNEEDIARRQHPLVLLPSKADGEAGGEGGEQRFTKEEQEHEEQEKWVKEESEEVAHSFDGGGARDPVRGTTTLITKVTIAENELLPATPVAVPAYAASDSSSTATLRQAEDVLKDLYEIHDSFFSADKDEKHVRRLVQATIQTIQTVQKVQSEQTGQCFAPLA